MLDTVNDKTATKIIFANATFQTLVYNRPTVFVRDGNTQKKEKTTAFMHSKAEIV